MTLLVDALFEGNLYAPISKHGMQISDLYTTLGGLWPREAWEQPPDPVAYVSNVEELSTPKHKQHKLEVGVTSCEINLKERNKFFLLKLSEVNRVYMFAETSET